MRVRRVAKAFSLWKKEDKWISLIGLFSKKSHLASWQVQNQAAMCQMCTAAVGPSAACFCAICHSYIWLTRVSEVAFTVQLLLHYSCKFNQKKVNWYPARLESEHSIVGEQVSSALDLTTKLEQPWHTLWENKWQSGTVILGLWWPYKL